MIEIIGMFDTAAGQPWWSPANPLAAGYSPHRCVPVKHVACGTWCAAGAKPGDVVQIQLLGYETVRMAMKTRLIVLAAAVVLVSPLWRGTAFAQQPRGQDSASASAAAAKSIPSFAGPSSSSVRNSPMTTAELRQARALYRAQQRVARLEYNLWMGHEPLRPSWNAVPMMSSRYAPRQVYIPVYVYPR